MLDGTGNSGVVVGAISSHSLSVLVFQLAEDLDSVSLPCAEAHLTVYHM